MKKFLIALALMALTGLFAAAAAYNCGHDAWVSSFEYESNGSDTHKALCPECREGFIEEPHTFDSNFSADENYHYRPCTKCGEKKDNYEHTFQHFEYDNDERHKVLCGSRGCTYFKYEPHDIGVFARGGGRHKIGCSRCRYGYDEYCAYGAWGKYDADNHARYCKTEGCDNSETQAHTFTDYLTNDEYNHFYVCTVCEERKGVAAHDMSVYTGADGGRHIISCTEGCGYGVYENCAPATLLCGAATKCAKCTNMIASQYADHDYEQRHDGANHRRVCLRASCTFIDTPTAHSISYASVDDDTHKASCAACPYSFTENHTHVLKKDETEHWEECFCGHKYEIEAHFSAVSANCVSKAVCDVCAQVFGELGDHTLEIRSDDANHWLECVIEGCGHVAPSEAHDMLYVDCGENYVCSVCARESILPAEHNWETATVAPKCAQNGSILVKCAICHDESTTIIAKRGHYYGDWASTGAGKHTAMCVRCDYKLTRDCAIIEIEGLGEMCLICGASETLKPTRVSDWEFTRKKGNIGDVCLWYFEDYNMLVWMVEFGGECVVNTGKYNFTYKLPGAEREAEIKVNIESGWHFEIIS